jgi:hypothetical protein
MKRWSLAARILTVLAAQGPTSPPNICTAIGARRIRTVESILKQLVAAELVVERPPDALFPNYMLTDYGQLVENARPLLLGPDMGASSLTRTLDAVICRSGEGTRGSSVPADRVTFAAEDEQRRANPILWARLEWALRGLVGAGLYERRDHPDIGERIVVGPLAGPVRTPSSLWWNSDYRASRSTWREVASGDDA